MKRHQRRTAARLAATTGAGGVIGSLGVAKSPADGYSLIFAGIASQGILPVMQKPAP